MKNEFGGLHSSKCIEHFYKIEYFWHKSNVTWFLCFKICECFNIYMIHFEGRAGEGREEGLGLAYKMNFSFKI